MINLKSKTDTRTSIWCFLLFLLTVFSPFANAEELKPTLQTLETPAREKSTEPHLAKGPDGTVILSWVSRGEDKAALRYATLQENGWETPQTVASGSNWFLNYADFPSVVPINNALWAAHWLVKRPGGTYAYDVALSLSVNRGETWSKPFAPHRDNTMTEHGFVSLFPLQDTLGVLWLDGRNMDTSETASVYKDNELGGMTLRAANITADSTIADEYLVDALVCDCCQTDVAMGPAGPIAVYRDRSPEEIRDIYVSRMLEGRWSQGTAVGHDGWEIDGCPVNGPSISASGSDVAVAWFTSANNIPHVRLAVSNDGGATFSKAINIDTGKAIGRVDVVLLESGQTVVSWMRMADGWEEELVIRVVSRSGETGPAQLISTDNAYEPSGFPKMISQDNRLIFAWTDVSAGEPMVQTAVLELE